MTKTQWAITATMLVSVCAATGKAAEKIRFENLSIRLARDARPGDNRISYKVTTLDKKVHQSGTLVAASDHVRVGTPTGWEDLPASQVSRIEIRKRRHYTENILGGVAAPLVLAMLACDESHNPLCVVGFTAVFSPIWAYTAVRAPGYLAAEGIALFIPSKTYEIVR